MSDPTPADELLFEGRFIRGVRRGRWEFVERVRQIAAVMIVAVTPEDELIIVEQYRPPVASHVLELPAGLAGDLSEAEDETLETAAHRELLEETGYQAGTLVPLTTGPTSPGLANEVVTLFLARDLKQVHSGGGDHAEDIKVHRVPLQDAKSWLEKKASEGLKIEPRIYAGIYFAMNRPL